MDPTNGVPNFFEKDRSMTYKRVAVFDNRGEDLLQHLESCISFIEQVRTLQFVGQCFPIKSRSLRMLQKFPGSRPGFFPTTWTPPCPVPPSGWEV